MLKGFKDFLMRGNVIDLAVAVVVGSAFTALVTTFTSSIIEPFIAATGGSEVTGLAITLQDGNLRSVIDFAAVINAVITFLLTAGVVYFLFVAPMQKLQNMRKTTEEAEPTDVELLQEIRDLLRKQQGLDEATTADAASVTVEAEATDRVGNGQQN
ncbi:large conductance mechanosensitive channel protein MscL [Saccharopolyspora sp. HNM0983]|uniref:Large-conductance mechanosensitive channel n=1 Tax=Saccharopolyspora montiporae TaxID=2781240 RepID=A0A929BAB9_9PSEU|nr:large conductance mechanosensitive channel protein MscL [Saccharopolyspora sp. HNM0983]